MKKNRIIFRADGNLIAGYGHVIRALSLAAMLKNKYHLVFIIQNPDAFLKTQVKKTCDEIVEIPETKNLITESKKIANEIINSNDIVVLDGYGYEAHYQSEIKKACFKLICIDDIYNRHFVADAIINHSEGINKNDYSIEPFSKLYLGCQYAILRQSFLKKNKVKAPSKQNKHTVFINMGGTDQQNFTNKALLVCLKNKSIKNIHIVVGSYYPYKKDLEKIATDNKHLDIQIHSNLSEEQIASLMKKSSAAICSASTIAYEYACLGGLLFVYQTVDNQKNIYSFLIKSKVAYPLQAFEKTLAAFNTKAANAYFKNRSNYFFGNSTKNLQSIFENLEKERGISIRLANQKDVITYFKWANDADVRKNSVSTAPIPIENHKKWFANKIESKNARLYIIESNGKPLGQVRFDKEKNKAEIDYSIDKKYRGKGYGEIILKDAITEYLNLYPKDKIIAKAKKSNTASNRVFEKLGFKKLPNSTINRISYSNYEFNKS